MKRTEKKRLYSLVLAYIIALTTPILTACKEKEDSKEVPEKNILDNTSSDIYRYNDYVQYKIQDNKAVAYYKGENIYYAVNRETYECIPLICHFDFTPATYSIAYVYEIPSGNMINWRNALNSDQEYFDYLQENYEFIAMKDIGNYIEGETSKEWYSYEKVMKYESEIIDAVKKINQLKLEFKNE